MLMRGELRGGYGELRGQLQTLMRKVVSVSNDLAPACSLILRGFNHYYPITPSTKLLMLFSNLGGHLALVRISSQGMCIVSRLSGVNPPGLPR